MSNEQKLIRNEEDYPWEGYSLWQLHEDVFEVETH
jgi:hypothetical protein